jgi:phage-related protein
MAEEVIVEGGGDLNGAKFANAATEATLLKLIEEIKKVNGTAAANKVAGVAASAGLDPAIISEVNQEHSKLYKNGQKLGASYGALSNVADSVAVGFKNVAAAAQEITSGTGNVSGVLAQFGRLPGLLGLVFQGMSSLASYQENLLKTYQDLTRAGANFGGSLTDMRQAASNAYLTLDQFSNLVKNNSESFARMGSTVDQGLKSFVKLSNEFVGSPLGRQLRNLGMTTEEINEEMIKYIAATGGRSKKELENTDALKKSTTEYLTELDALTKFTGISKKKLEEEQKKAQMNEAFQRKMANMDEAERAKLKAAYDKAAASGIAGATDLVMSAALGLPPVTEAAQTLSGVAPQTAEALTDMTRTAITAGTTQQQVTDKFGRVLTTASDQAKRFGQTGDALALQQGKYQQVVGSLIGVENKLRAKGITDEATLQKELAKAYDEQIKQQESQAADAVKTQEAMQKLGQLILEKILPIVEKLFAVFNPVVTFFAKTLTTIGRIPYAFEILGAGLLALIAVIGVAKARAAVLAVSGGARAGGVGGVLDVLGGRPAAPGTGPIVPPAANRGVTTPVIPPGGGAGAATAGRAAGIVGSIGNAVKGIGVGVGGAIRGILKGLASGLQAMANPKVMLGSVSLGLLAGSLYISAKAFKEFTDVSWKDVAAGTVAIGLLAAGAAALSFIAPAIFIGSAAIAALGASIWVLAKGLSAFPTGVIEGLMAPFNALGKIVGTVFESIGGMLSSLLDGIKSIFGTVWDVVSWPFKQIGNLVSSIFGGVTTAASSLLDGIKSIFGTVWDVISWPFKQIGSLVSGAFDNIGSIFSGLTNTVKSVFDAIWNVMSWPFKQLASIISAPFETMSGVIKSFGDLVTGVFKWIFDKISNVLGMIKGAASAVAKLFGFGKDKPETEAKKDSSINDSLSKAASLLLDAAKSLKLSADLLASNIKMPLQPGTLKAGIFDKDQKNNDTKQAKQKIPDEYQKLLDNNIYSFAKSLFGGTQKTELLDKEKLSPINQSALKYVAAGPMTEKPKPTISTISESFAKPNPAIKDKKFDEVSGLDSLMPDKSLTDGSLKGLELLKTELQTLNKQSAEMLRYLRETAEYAKRNVDATSSLGGDLFKF